MGLADLKWKYCAANIKKAIKTAAPGVKEGYQIPVARTVAIEILDAPTKDRVSSLSPKPSNSLTTTEYLNIQT